MSIYMSTVYPTIFNRVRGYLRTKDEDLQRQLVHECAVVASRLGFNTRNLPCTEEDFAVVIIAAISFRPRDFARGLRKLSPDGSAELELANFLAGLG